MLLSLYIFFYLVLLLLFRQFFKPSLSVLKPIKPRSHILNIVVWNDAIIEIWIVIIRLAMVITNWNAQEANEENRAHSNENYMLNKVDNQQVVKHDIGILNLTVVSVQVRVLALVILYQTNHNHNVNCLKNPFKSCGYSRAAIFAEFIAKKVTKYQVRQIVK